MQRPTPGILEHQETPENLPTENSTPSVSVVIPAYNRAKSIGRAIHSVQAQDAEILEILVVDDGSTDDTAGVVRAAAEEDRRVRLIEHPQNKGEAGARNTGVRAAQGELIAFLDSDDEWLPGKLSAQLTALQSAPVDVGAIATGYEIVDGAGIKSVVHDWTESFPITDRNLLVRGCGVSMGLTFLIRKSVYEKIGYYDEDLPLLVDLDWLCRFSREYEILKLNGVLARYDKAPMRRGEPMVDAVRKFKSKNAVYLNSFGIIDRLGIESRFYNYISQGYAANGPWHKFVGSRVLHFLTNPVQHPGNYFHFLMVLFGIKRVPPPAQIVRMTD